MAILDFFLQRLDFLPILPITYSTLCTKKNWLKNSLDYLFIKSHKISR